MTMWQSVARGNVPGESLYVFVVRSVLLSSMVLLACEAGSDEVVITAHGDPLVPDAAPRVAVDRLGDGSTAPIDFDADFFVEGFGPQGEAVSYYDFGPSSGFTMAAFRLVDEDGVPVDDQRLIIGALPGAPEYSDFWQVTEVEVPPGYLANSITSVAEVMASGYPRTPTVEVLNRPVVPEGSSARFGTDDGRLFQAWVEDEIALAFDFAEGEFGVRGDLVDYVPIYVCLTEDGAFCTDPAGRTHNVVASIPTADDYSPLWKPSVFPEASFDDVVDLDSALAQDPEELPMLVNCPLVEW